MPTPNVDNKTETKLPGSELSTITADFLQDLVREMREGFSAQGRQIERITSSLRLREMSLSPPPKPLLGDLNASQEQMMNPGVGMAHMTYHPFHPSQRFIY